jgi:hypothetical protein
MSIGTILLIILILALVGALPTWGYSSGWGYGPSGIAGVVVIILIILLLTGRLYLESQPIAAGLTVRHIATSRRRIRVGIRLRIASDFRIDR